MLKMKNKTATNRNTEIEILLININFFSIFILIKTISILRQNSISQKFIAYNLIELKLTNKGMYTDRDNYLDIYIHIYNIHTYMFTHNAVDLFIQQKPIQINFELSYHMVKCYKTACSNKIFHSVLQHQQWSINVLNRTQNKLKQFDI